MPNKRLRYMGKTYEVEPWGGARNVDTPPTSAESSPVHKKLRGTEDTKEIVHRRFTNTMDGDTDMGEASSSAAKAAASTGGSTAQHKHETKVLSLRPQYGLDQVITVTLPFTMYFSAVTSDVNNALAQDFYFKTTSLANIFPKDLSDPTAGASYSMGLYKRLASSGTTWPNPNRAFPRTTADGTMTTEAPQWLKFWAKLYQAYTVIKTEWEVTIHNPRAANNADLIIGYGPEAYGSSSGIQYPTTYLSSAEHFPDLKFKLIPGNNDGSTRNQFTTISGTYYPGMVSEHVSNDEDITTWNKYTDPTALPSPALTEQMKFFLWKGPFNSEPTNQAVNIRLSLRITAQFRDLQEAFRYPAGQTAISLTGPTDIYQA